MGDYSRNTFKLTNSMHQILNNELVEQGRNYVSVKLQQGVPLLDADWNEMDEIRRQELRAITKYAIGTSIQTDDDGFRISGVNEVNNFTINPGAALIDGQLIILPEATSYNSQPYRDFIPNALPDISTPSAGPRNDLVYLDVWEEEVEAQQGNFFDSRLVNEAIGVPTTTRVERRWLVRIAEGQDEIPDREYGHHYIKLALIQRDEGQATITDSFIEDCRARGLSLAEHVKVPLYIKRGSEIYDKDRFSRLMANLGDILTSRFRYAEFYYALPSGDYRNEMVIMNSLQRILNLTQVAENQAFMGLINNSDALGVLDKLYFLQVAWLNLLEDLGLSTGFGATAYNTALADFIRVYDSYLKGTGSSDDEINMRAALDGGDLSQAIVAQEAIVEFLGFGATGGLAISDSRIVLINPSYDDSLRTFIITGEFTVEFTNSAAEPELFDLEMELDPRFGFASAVNSAGETVTQLEFSPEVQQQTLTIRVTVLPEGSDEQLPSAPLGLLLRSARFPTFNTEVVTIQLAVDEQPQAPTLVYDDSVLPNDLTRDRLFWLNNTLNLSFNFFNTEGIDTVYQIRAVIIVTEGFTNQWNLDAGNRENVQESPEIDIGESTVIGAGETADISFGLGWVLDPTNPQFPIAGTQVTIVARAYTTTNGTSPIGEAEFRMSVTS